jgi:hypothetical protein
MKSKLFTFLMLAVIIAFANDGVFHMNGNQLIPITETDISVKKEILTITRTKDNMIEVHVYYEFFNPKDGKDLLVGFEAMSPSGDADVTPINGGHPYMKNFTVQLNKEQLQHDVAIVKTEKYFVNNSFVSHDTQKIINEIGDNTNYADFFYVYYFNAHFKPGLNIIEHTYTFHVSGAIDLGLYFQYVLTAARRWANQQIDDFTLIIDMGEFETFYIAAVFFENADDWTIEGEGTKFDRSEYELYFSEDPCAQFHIRKGRIVFHQKDFYPKYELFLFTGTYYNYDEDEKFDFSTDYLPFPLRYQDNIPEPANVLSKSILRNLPFARRGYVFQNKYIKTYYETMVDWYVPDPDYTATMESLTPEERAFVEKYK